MKTIILLFLQIDGSPRIEHIFGQKIRGGGYVKRMIVSNDDSIQRRVAQLKEEVRC
jgi:hypothetical protein